MYTNSKYYPYVETKGLSLTFVLIWNNIEMTNVSILSDTFAIHNSFTTPA